MIREKELLFYETLEGRVPLEQWLKLLTDRKGRAIIRTRLDRLAYGCAGRCESVGEGIHELKIDFGPGYRVYFAGEDMTRILLLCGGDKDSQKRDIRKAKKYWADHKMRMNR